MCCDYCMFVIYKIREMYFRLLGTKDFNVKAKIERFIAAGSRCRKNLKYENFTSSFGRLCKKNPPKSVPRNYFSHSTNEITDSWRCRCRCRRQFLNSLKRACAKTFLSDVCQPETKCFSFQTALTPSRLYFSASLLL